MKTNENQQPNLNKNDDHLDVDHQQVFLFIQVKSKRKTNPSQSNNEDK